MQMHIMTRIWRLYEVIWFEYISSHGMDLMSCKYDHFSPSMYGIFTYIWLIFMGNVGKYTIHGWYGTGFTLFCRQGLDIFWTLVDALPLPLGMVTEKKLHFLSEVWEFQKKVIPDHDMGDEEILKVYSMGCRSSLIWLFPKMVVPNNHRSSY